MKVLSREELAYLKMVKKQSRTWKIVIYWLIAPVVLTVAQIVLAYLGSSISLPLELVWGGALIATGSFMGKRTVQILKEGKENNARQ